MKKTLQKSMHILIIILAVMVAVILFMALAIAYGDGGMLQPLAIALFMGLLVFAAGRSLAKPLSMLAVKPIDPDSSAMSEYEELSPLLRRIEDQRSIIKESASELKEREHSLQAITENLQEGLALLDAKGIILSMNKSAYRFLRSEGKDFTGRHMLAVSPDESFQALVNSALGGAAGESELCLGDEVLRVTASPVWVEGTVRGAVILVFDITAKREAERLRREFSANVSHELKTPLTSLSGYAEIMKDGLVKPEDIAPFSEKIYNEARRMIGLIDDIIKISRLDEDSGDIALTSVDLFKLARETLEELGPVAERYGVSLGLSGSSANVLGNEQLLDDILFNLCDNAIKYNRPGGNVEVSVEPGGSGTVLTVRDSGIGIPSEHRQRIFERFYRVDKSHSKDTGGTGLGLSIVKHAAAFHNAALELDSAPGEGTAITLRFESGGSKTDVS